MMRMINLLSVAIIFLLSSCTSKDAVVPEPINFNYNWEFFKASGDPATPPADAVWESVDLPHTANIEPLVVNDQWQGICFYKKEFTLEADHPGKELFLKFEAAMNIADVWVNGEKLITNMGGYLPFVINITSIAQFDKPNEILVRLDNRDNLITGPKPLEILDFNMYGGIYRNTWLIAKNKVHITDPVEADVIAGGGLFFAATSVSKEVAEFEVKTHVLNSSDNNERVKITHKLFDASGKTVTELSSDYTQLNAGESTESILNGKLDNPNLWSPSNPSLYTLETRVFSNGKLTDKQTTRVGIRKIEISKDGLWLNGEKTFLRGVNRHQEYPYVGYAMSDAAQYRDAWLIKEAGFDFVRGSHYPMSPAFMSACDELGLFVLDAILGWQYFGGEEFEKLALRACRQLIRRDRNHPSILAWELSVNETRMPASFTDSAHIIAHEEFPYPSNYSAGWVRSPYDIYVEARQHRHRAYPNLPLLVSEYGDWEYYAQNAGLNQDEWRDLLPEERTSRQPRESGEKRMLQQALNIQEAHNDNLSTHAFADAFWVMFDYNRGMAPDHEYSGIMDIFRLPKFSYYFYKSQRTYSPENPFSKPVVHIASHWQPGISSGVKIYSNCDEVELFLDGVSLGRKMPDQSRYSTNLHHPPFIFELNCEAPGTLKAQGYINGNEVASHAVTTAGNPANIHLEAGIYGSEPRKGMNDVVFIYAHILDDAGNPVFDASNMVEFKVSGDAEIIGGNSQPALGGIATALLKIGRTVDEITIQASSEGLPNVELVLKPE